MISNNKIISLVDKLIYKFELYNYKPDLIISIGIDNVYTALKIRDKIDKNINVENINFSLTDANFANINKTFLENKKVLFVTTKPKIDIINRTINYIRNECNLTNNLALCTLINNISYDFQLDDRFEFYYSTKKIC